MRKKQVLWLLKIGVAFILLFILYQEVNKGHAVYNALKKANWVNVTFCFILLFPNFIFQFIKWRFMLNTRYPEIGNTLAFKSLLFGSTLGFITPGNLGELGRALFFKKYDRLTILGLNVVDKIFNQVIIISVGFISVYFIIFKYFPFPGYVIYPLFILSLIFLIILWILILNPQLVINFLNGKRNRLMEKIKIKHLASGLKVFTWKHSLKMTGFSFCWYIVIVFQYHILVAAFTDITLLESFPAVSSVLFTKLVLPISFADLGIREGASIFYFSLFGIPKAAAFNAALLVFLINLLIPALIGSYYLFRLRWEVRNEKNLGTNQEKGVIASHSD